MKRAALTLALLLLALGFAAPAAAEPPDWAHQLPAELMSPFCPGRTLADCPSPAAESMRLWILTQAAAGRSRGDIEAELFARYGDVMRSAPLAEGVGLGAYLFPVAAFAAGGVLVAFVLRRMTRSAPGAPAVAPPAPAPGDPELERLVDEELAR